MMRSNENVLCFICVCIEQGIFITNILGRITNTVIINLTRVVILWEDSWLIIIMLRCHPSHDIEINVHCLMVFYHCLIIFKGRS